MSNRNIILLIIIVGFLSAATVGVWQSGQNNKAKTKTEQSSQQEEVKKPEEGEHKIARTTSIADITFNNEKTNIYFFWGDGCGYCAKEFKFWERIQDEYGEMYNLFPLEIWGNEENRALADKMAASLGEEVTGVPYTIIGNKSFSGFSESYEEKMIAAIKEAYENKGEEREIDNIARQALGAS